MTYGKANTSWDAADNPLGRIKRKTCNHYSAPKCIVGDWTSLRGEDSMAVLECRESHAESRYPSRSEELLTVGLARFAGIVQLPPNVVGIGTDDGRHSEVPYTLP